MGSYPELAHNIKPTIVHILQAQVLALSCLQPIRDMFGTLIVTSWLRDETLNAKVGGSLQSDHLYGSAADFISIDENVEAVFRWVVEVSEIPYRQVIYYPDKNFIHISCNHPRKPLKNEALICTGPGKYIEFSNYYGE